MKLTTYLYWLTEAHHPDGGRFTVNINGDMNGYDGRWTLLASAEVDFDTQEVDPRALMIKSLQTAKEKIVAESAQAIACIEDKLQQLQALPQPEAA